jgi:hypothetical protein
VTATRRLESATESEVRPGIIAWFEAAGCPVIRTPAGHPWKQWGVQCAPKDWPDLVVLIPPGRVLFCETKRPRGDLRPSQRLLHDWLRRNGYHVETVRSIEEAKRARDRARNGEEKKQ